MAVWMLWLVTGCYLITALDLWLAQRPGLALVFVAYALANVGMIWEVLRPTQPPA